MTSLSMWKLSATRAMLLVRLPTMSSTNMNEAVMLSIPSNRGLDPHPVQLNVLGNFILTTNMVRRLSHSEREKVGILSKEIPMELGQEF